ncbi:MAG TPA: hypothetical protein VGE44_10640, partial [Daejeonella sp.]|uniref:hypothetical protein n=1 Tax=Daejeonella sp. TaxID=2805397 RepID=UPI002ED7CFC5
KNLRDYEKTEKFLRKREDNYMFYLRTVGQQRYNNGLYCDGMRWRVKLNDLSLQRSNPLN